MNSPAKGSGLLRFCSVPNLWSQVKPKLVPSNSTHFVIPWFYLRKQGGTPGREPWCETDAAENPTFRLHTFWGTQRITSQPKQLKCPEWAPRVHPPASCCSERIQCGCSQGLCCYFNEISVPPCLLLFLSFPFLMRYQFPPFSFADAFPIKQTALIFILVCILSLNSFVYVSCPPHSHVLNGC